MSTITEKETQIIRQIKKVKLGKNGGIIIEYEQTATIVGADGKPIEFYADPIYPGRSLPHPDFLHSLDLLRGHLAILCSQLDGRESIFEDLEEDEEFIKLFKVTGFSMGGSGDSEGVTLIGSKKIKRGILNLVTPFTRYYDENDRYDYGEELAHLIVHATNEANLYIDGKIAPDAQGKLFNDDQDSGKDFE